MSDGPRVETHPVDPRSGADMDAIVRLYSGYCAHYETQHPERAIRQFLSARLLSSESVVFLARAGGAAAGFVQLYPKYSSTTLDRHWILNDLFVDPAHRRTGVAGALLERSEGFARSAGSSVIVLKTHVTNAPARAAYEARGWSVADDFLTYKRELG